MWFRRTPATEPDFGPEFEQFRDGLAELRRDGQIHGHVATTVGRFRTPFAPRSPQPWVWFVVVWIDGEKERSVEDYPPWTYVAEMRGGSFDWAGGRWPDRAGLYDIEWVPADLAAGERDRLGIRPEDF